MGNIAPGAGDQAVIVDPATITVRIANTNVVIENIDSQENLLIAGAVSASVTQGFSMASGRQAGMGWDG